MWKALAIRHVVRQQQQLHAWIGGRHARGRPTLLACHTRNGCWTATTTTAASALDQRALFSSTSKQPRTPLDNNNNKQPRKRTTTPSNHKAPSSKIVVASFARQLQQVLRQAESITTTLPWKMEDDGDSVNMVWDPQRVVVYRQTLELWDTFLQHVHTGSIQPQGKHRREASIFCETLLRLYAQSSNDNQQSDNKDGDATSTVWESCLAILDFMKLHKLTVQEEHVHATLCVAVRYGHYTTAAQLFCQQIDPNQAGYRPYRTMSVAQPVGLFALAKDAQAREAAVVDNVMHAVHQLCMVSPSDQDLYVLAAGTALGHVQQGLALLNYLQTSLEAPRLGPTLVAATMQALLLSDQAQQAWNLWEERHGGTAAEWQWAGGQEQLPLLCSDLALRAAPAVDFESAEPILALYRSLVQEAGRAVSIEALVGVMCVLEQHRAWEDAVHLWLQIVARAARGHAGLVYGDELVSPDVLADESSSSTTTVNADLVQELSHVVVPVMRACQGAQEHALALLCLSLWQGCGETRASLLAKNESEDNLWSSRFQSTIQQSSNGDDLLLATMTSLASFDLPEGACDLYDACVAGRESADFAQSQDLRDFLATQTSPFQPSLRNRRLSTLGDETQRFTLVLASQPSDLSNDDARVISSAMASTMESFSTWHHPLVSLHLFRFMMDGGRSVASLEDVPEILSKGTNALPITDSLAAALMRAYSRMDNPEMALRIFETVSHGVSRYEVGCAWPLAATSAIKILFSQNAVDEAMYLFQEVAGSSRNPDLYASTARSLATHHRWKEVSDVYRLALSSHALSEEVCLFAMKAIDMMKMPGKTRLMRSVAHEAAALTGMAPLAWTERQYHGLKNVISFAALRRLLWWDDSKTAFLDELELVLGQWEARKATPTSAGEAIAPPVAAVRIILQNAKSLNDRSIPASKTRIPHVPRDPSAWKRLVDEIVHDLDLSVWKGKSGRFLAKDVIEAYRNLGSDQDCLAFTFQCLEKEISIGPDALEQAISAAVAMKDDHAANTLRMIMDGNGAFA